MICLVLLLLPLTYVAAQHQLFEEEAVIWRAYKKSYDRTYHGYEDFIRRFIFSRNLNLIRVHNSEADLGFHSYWLGVNAFTDMTDDEFMKRRTGSLLEEEFRLDQEAWMFFGRADAPDSIDWEEKGYVTSVKDQGDCGSCWAFSATGALEALQKNASGRLVSLSEQNLVDCASPSDGCRGGLMSRAFEYVRREGIDKEDCYNYQAVSGPCRFKRWCSQMTIRGEKIVRPEGSENALKLAVVDRPVSVGIKVSSKFRHYQRGIFDDPLCKSQGLHAVLVVGYGTERGHDFWRVKNSWGADWGMKGYIKMSRNKNNQCCIASMAIFPF